MKNRKSGRRTKKKVARRVEQDGGGFFDRISDAAKSVASIADRSQSANLRRSIKTEIKSERKGDDGVDKIQKERQAKIDMVKAVESKSQLTGVVIMMFSYIYDAYIATRTQMTPDDAVFFASEQAELIKLVMRILNGYHKLLNDAMYCPDAFPVWDEKTLRAFHINTATKDKTADFTKDDSTLQVIRDFNKYHGLLKAIDIPADAVIAPIGEVPNSGEIINSVDNTTPKEVLDVDNINLDMPDKSQSSDTPEEAPELLPTPLPASLLKTEFEEIIKKLLNSDDKTKTLAIEIDNSATPAGIIHPYLPVVESYFADFQSIKNHILFFSLFLAILVDKYQSGAGALDTQKGYPIYDNVSNGQTIVYMPLENTKKLVEVADSLKYASKSYQVAYRLAEQTASPFLLIGKSASGLYSGIKKLATDKRRGGKNTRGPKHKRGQKRQRQTRKRHIKGGMAMYSTFKSVLHTFYNNGERRFITTSFTSEAYAPYIKRLSNALHKKVMLTMYVENICKTFLENAFRFDIDLDKNDRPVSDEDDIITKELTDATNTIGKQIEDEVECFNDILIIAKKQGGDTSTITTVFNTTSEPNKPDTTEIDNRITEIESAISVLGTVSNQNKFKRIYYSFKRRDNVMGFVDFIKRNGQDINTAIENYAIPTEDTLKTKRQSFFANSVATELEELKVKTTRIKADIEKEYILANKKTIVASVEAAINDLKKNMPFDPDVNAAKRKYIREVLLKDPKYARLPFLNDDTKLDHFLQDSSPVDQDSQVDQLDKYLTTGTSLPAKANRYYYSELRKKLYTEPKTLTIRNAQKEDTAILKDVRIITDQYKQLKVSLFSSMLGDYMKAKDAVDLAKAENADEEMSGIIKQFDAAQTPDIPLLPEEVWGKEMKTNLINLYKENAYEKILRIGGIKENETLIDQGNKRQQTKIDEIYKKYKVDTKNVDPIIKAEAKIVGLNAKITYYESLSLPQIKSYNNAIMGLKPYKAIHQFPHRELYYKKLTYIPDTLVEHRYFGDEKNRNTVILMENMKESPKKLRELYVINYCKQYITDTGELPKLKQYLGLTTDGGGMFDSITNMGKTIGRVAANTATIGSRAVTNVASGVSTRVLNTLSSEKEIQSEFYEKCLGNYIASINDATPTNAEYLATLQKLENAKIRLGQILKLYKKRINETNASLIEIHIYDQLKKILDTKNTSSTDTALAEFLVLNRKYGKPNLEPLESFILYYKLKNKNVDRINYLKALEIQMGYLTKKGKQFNRLMKSVAISIGVTTRFIMKNGALAGLVIALTAASWGVSFVPALGPISLALGFALGQARNLVLILGAPFMEQPEIVITRKADIEAACKELMPRKNVVGNSDRNYDFVKDIVLNSYEVLEYFNLKLNFAVKLQRNLEKVDENIFRVHPLKRLFASLIDADLIDFDSPAQKKLKKRKLYELKNLDDQKQFRSNVEIEKEIIGIIGENKYTNAEKQMKIYLTEYGGSVKFKGTFSMGLLFGVGGFGIEAVIIESAWLAVSNLLASSDLQSIFKHPNSMLLLE